MDFAVSSKKVCNQGVYPVKYMELLKKRKVHISIGGFETKTKSISRFDFPSELLKVEDVETRACAKISRICAKFVLLNAKLENQALFYDFGTI